MKQLIATLILTLLLFQACKPSAGKEPQETTVTNDSAVLNHVLDTYKGDFGNSSIYITFNYLNGQHIAGYNVHKGLRRNLYGELKKENSNWVLTLSEPADHPFDGKFVLTFDPTFNTAKGTWTPLNDKTLKEKTFELKRNSGHGQDALVAAGSPTFDGFYIEDKFYKSDITFNADGSCLLQLYEQVNDSTIADQMLRIKGTYERVNDTTLHVTWGNNTHFKERTSNVKLNVYQESDGSQYLNGVEFEDLRFVSGP